MVGCLFPDFSELGSWYLVASLGGFAFLGCEVEDVIER